MLPTPPERLSGLRSYPLMLAVLATLLSIDTRAELQTNPTDTVSNTRQGAALSSYVARYKTSARGFTLYLERELRTRGDNRYVLTNGGKILVVGFHEVSVFTVSEGQVYPQSYIYQGTGLVNRKREVHFDSGNVVRSLYKDTWYELPNSPGTLDRMSQWEQVRLALLGSQQPFEEISLRVADGKRVKNSSLVLVGEEDLITVPGTIKTLHFKRLHDNAERQSDIWFAPQWDYLMVKTIHVEDGEPVEVNLVSAAIDGTPVTAR
jgi:hypothetical protein